MPYQGRQPSKYPDTNYRYILEPGTVGAPTLSFFNDSNNGLWSPALDNIAISTNGAERFRVTEGGAIGIGTASPSQLLHLNNSSGQAHILVQASGTNNARLQLQQTTGLVDIGSNATNVFIQDNAARDFNINTNNTERFRITSTGNVGIGTSNPQNSLHIVNTANFIQYPIRLENTGTSGVTLGSAIRFDAYNGTSNVYLGALLASASTWAYGTYSPNQLTLLSIGSGGVALASANAPITFRTGNSDPDLSTEKARIDNTGRLLVGTTSSTASTSAIFQGTTAGPTGIGRIFITRGSALSTSGGNLGQLFFSDSTHSLGPNITSTAASGWGDSGNYPGNIIFNIPTEAMRISSTGNVGIGTSGPTSKLSVNGYITESTDGTNYWNVVTQQDIGTAANQVPLNQYLGSMAYQDASSVNITGSLLVDGGTLTVDPVNNRVGIGTTGPSFPVDVTYSDTTAYTTTSGVNAFRLVNYSPGSAGIFTSIMLQANGNFVGAAQVTIACVQDTTTNATGHLAFSTRHNASLSEKVRITSTGNLGVGVINPGYKLDVQDGINIRKDGSSFVNLYFNSIATRIRYNDATGHLSFITNSAERAFVGYLGGFNIISGGLDISGGNIVLSGADRSIINNDNNALILGTNAVERFRITATGCVGIADSSPANNAKRLSIRHTDDTDNTTPTVNIYRAASSSGGSGSMEVGLNVNVPFCFNSNSTTGIKVYTGTGLENTSYAIDAEVSKSNNGVYRAARFTGGQGNIGGYGSQTVVDIIAGVAGTGVQGKVYGLYIQNPNYDYTGGTGQNTGILLNDLTTASVTHSAIRFDRNGTTVGSITTTTSATAFNTSSDYRLKENIVLLDNAIDRLKLIPVHRFNFISDPDKTVDGFLAHEVSPYVPESVTGKKDEVEVSPLYDENNKPVLDENEEPIYQETPKYQSIDQSKLVPLLTAALQEAIAKIEELQTRLDNAGL